MSRVLQPTTPTQPPVLPGTQIVAPIQMSTAVNAGDYVYTTASGAGVAAASGAVGISTQIVGYSVITSSSQSGTLPQFQYGPVTQQGTYSGSTYTLGQQILSATQVTTTSTSGYNQFVITMANGNFVYFNFDNSQGSFIFRIYDTAGTLVAGPTVIAAGQMSGSYSYRNFCAYPLAAGGFLVSYFPYASGYVVYAKKYSATGTETASGTIYMNANVLYYGCSCAELSNGNFVFTAIDANNYGLYGVTNSSFAIVSSPTYINPSSTYYGGMNGTSYYFNLAALTGGGFVLSWFNSSSNVHNVSYYSNTGVLLSGSTPQSISSLTGVGSGNYRTFAICSTSDDGFAIAFSTGATIYSYKFFKSGNTINVSSPIAGSTVSTSSVTDTCINIIPTQNGGIALYYFQSNTIPYIVFSTSTAGAITYGSPTNIFSSAYSTYGCYVSPMSCFMTSTSKRIMIPFINGSAYPMVAILSTQAITNGSALYGVPFAPPNYYLLGVSLDTVSTGGTANVVLNGTATLNSNYPSLTTYTPFDYSGNGQFGNSGFVYGRTVTLKGYQ